MYGNSVSKIGKNRSEAVMDNAALIEAKGWADALMNNEFKGRGDKEKSVRFRLSKSIGVPESYLYRLQYKTREMKDVAGSVYRSLKIAYDGLCTANEEAAERFKAERLRLKARHEEISEKPAAAGIRMVSAVLGKAARRKEGR